ncbi:unnamed protein product [Microthlaspi erraticum]|uniref:CCHC-type domain-containing protein n=1 Tax=Microthlaspi erraticum TaxID=1685480 RepID=A0A6D2K2Z3_9BRAS|nr:unnamed protein product [Microthlaspi erraticum]
MADGKEDEEDSNKSLSESLLEQMKKLMREEFERREQIKAGKRKESRDHIHISDEEGRNDPMASRRMADEQANAYYNSGHSSQGSRRRSRRHRDDPENLGGYKIRIPPFHGNNNPDEYMDWEKKCEFNFNLHNISNINRVKLAVSEFNDYALRWWEQIVTAREIGGALEVSTWEEMTRIMRQRFIPSYYQRELHSKLRRLTQGSKTVEEYFQEMEVMLLRANVVEDREATMSRFLGGLNREIQDIVEMQNCVGLESMLHKAVLAETQLKRRAPTRNGTDQRRPVYARDSKPIFTPKSEPRGVPYNQDKDKNKSSATPAPRARALKCFRCQGFGHYANECRNKKIIFIRDNGEVESEEEALEPDQEPEPKEYEAVPVMGKLLVARRLLSAQVQTHKDEQRENLFHSPCLVQEKVCSLIIDGGSCTNVASEAMVEKLGLVTQKHPKPYQLQWINETGDMSVKEQVVVPLSIGSYEDEI